MRTGVITKKTTELNWDAISPLPIDHLLWIDSIDITAQAKICYDETALYVRLSAKESSIRAEETGLLGMPCQDSCLEFFFSPIPGDERYLNIEFNPNACMYLGIGHDRYDCTRLVSHKENPLHPQVTRTSDGWEITYQIPYAFLRLFFPDFQAVSGGSIRANFYKCGDLTEKRHYLSWNKVGCEKPDFHRPEYFGTLYFE